MRTCLRFIKIGKLEEIVDHDPCVVVLVILIQNQIEK